MAYVNETACNGCGVCVDICPTGALIFQNHCAFIDQDLCRGCEICLDACPQSAILAGEIQPATPAVLQMPEVTSAVERPDQNGVRDMVLPAIGSLLLWTGRELVPRIADAALGYLDQRAQSYPSPMPQQLSGRGVGRASNPVGRFGRRRRKQHRRRNRRIF